ncbi:hypothetical protein GCM10010345_79930 [Streptomyces canarius]|uniref:Uncharacterized protein n=1 Tax=Streptomyces canarius TaxID=285453 RepID=A0ABQ3DA71_9ACTN|nr:hypothetical protein GCM10010345_79930 [Streptomyces canarius]
MKRSELRRSADPSHPDFGARSAFYTAYVTPNVIFEGRFWRCIAVRSRMDHAQADGPAHLTPSGLRTARTAKETP